MFAVDCPVLGQRLLVFPSQVRAVSNHEKGIDSVFRCACGGWGIWRSGARAPREELLRHDPPHDPAQEPGHGDAGGHDPVTHALSGDSA